MSNVLDDMLGQDLCKLVVVNVTAECKADASPFGIMTYSQNVPIQNALFLKNIDILLLCIWSTIVNIPRYDFKR